MTTNNVVVGLIQRLVNLPAASFCMAVLFAAILVESASPTAQMARPAVVVVRWSMWAVVGYACLALGLMAAWVVRHAWQVSSPLRCASGMLRKTFQVWMNQSYRKDTATVNKP